MNGLEPRWRISLRSVLCVAAGAAVADQAIDPNPVGAVPAIALVFVAVTMIATNVDMWLGWRWVRLEAHTISGPWRVDRDLRARLAEEL